MTGRDFCEPGAPWPTSTRRNDAVTDGAERSTRRQRDHTRTRARRAARRRLAHRGRGARRAEAGARGSAAHDEPGLRAHHAHRRRARRPALLGRQEVALPTVAGAAHPPARGDSRRPCGLVGIRRRDGGRVPAARPVLPRADAGGIAGDAGRAGAPASTTSHGTRAFRCSSWASTGAGARSASGRPCMRVPAPGTTTRSTGSGVTSAV